MKIVPLCGYSDRLSGRPGDVLNFMVSANSEIPKGETVTARVFRSISADPNPAGQGVVEENCDNICPPITFPAREQPFYPGSYAETTTPLSVTAEQELEFSARFFPTLPGGKAQTIISADGLALGLNETGMSALPVMTRSPR